MMQPKPRLAQYVVEQAKGSKDSHEYVPAMPLDLSTELSKFGCVKLGSAMESELLRWRSKIPAIPQGHERELQRSQMAASGSLVDEPQTSNGPLVGTTSIPLDHRQEWE